MNVNRRWLGTSVVRVRILAAGLVMLGAGCAVLGWGSRSRQAAAAQRPSAAIETVCPSAGPDVDECWAAGDEASEEPESRARSLFAGLPLMFEPNQGQGNLDASDPRAKFVTRGSGYSRFLGSEGAILSMVSQDRSTSGDSKRQSRTRRVDSIEMKLVGLNQKAMVTGADLLPGKSNYFIGNDPAKWRTGVRQFARVATTTFIPESIWSSMETRDDWNMTFRCSPGAIRRRRN